MDTTVGAAGGADLSLAFERRGRRPLRSFSMPFSVSLSRSRSLSFLPNESSAAADVGGAGAASILLILTAPSATTPTRTMGSSGSARATTRCTKVRCGAFARGGGAAEKEGATRERRGEEVETASGGRSRDEGEMRGGYRGSMSTAGASIVQSGDGRSAYRRSRPTAQGDVESDGGGGERGEGEGGEAKVAPVSEGEVRRLSGEGVGVLARFDADREPPRIHGFEFTMVMGGTDRYRARREGVDGCREPVRCGEAKDKQKAARAAAKPKPSRSRSGGLPESCPRQWPSCARGTCSNTRRNTFRAVARGCCARGWAGEAALGASEAGVHRHPLPTHGPTGTGWARRAHTQITQKVQ
ncbi:hypothetical protein B0H10DRAFT_1955379 [Mycena sp. CBHHK59/15]|nr:hypothetical protein B0H10DRAFT_1955379 [Mycena sp. CBHHK59/15]